VTEEVMMAEETGIEDIIQQAIAREEDSYALYTKAREMVRQPHVKDLLEDLAQAELGHKAKLEGLLREDVEKAVAPEHREEVIDLKIGDYLKPVSLGQVASIQDVLLLAMQKEGEARDFYTEMAQGTTGTTRNLAVPIVTGDGIISESRHVKTIW
jgi:rubrerythrin